MMEKDTETEIRTLLPSGKPAMRRIMTPKAAYDLYKRYLDADALDADRRGVIQGMIDGNPPYDPRELEDQGLSSITNVNFGSMCALLNLRAGAAHELFMEVPTLIEVRPLLPDKSDLFFEDHCRVIAQEFTEMVLAWPGFQVAMDLSFRESDAYGIGFCLWPDEYTWKPKSFKRGALLFDPMASVDVTSNDIYFVRDTMTVEELVTKTENPELARDEGWNITGIVEVLKRVFVNEESQDGTDKYQRSTLESFQQMRRNNDPDFESKQFQRIKVVHILCQEVAGDQKISHMIIPDNGSGPVFLYEAPNRFESMSHVLWWIPFNYGDGYAKSVRGVASWLAQHDDLSNRFLGRAFDSGFMSSSLLLQPTSAIDMGRLQFVQQGPYTIIPPELNIRQSSFQPQITQAIQLRAVSEDIMKNNTGIYRQNPETFNDGTPKTARQVAEESSRDARVEKAAVMHRYNHYEILYREMFRRAVALGLAAESEIPKEGDKEARRFIKRCLDRSVPKSLLKNYADKVGIFATRAIGMGSLGVRLDLTNQFMAPQIRGALDSEGQINVLQDWFAARVGQRNVGRYVRSYNRDMVPSSEHSFVALENNDLVLGQASVVGSDQIHRIHMLGHGQALVPILQAVQQGQVQDPMKAYQALQAFGQHIESHMQYMAQDPSQQGLVEQLKPVLQQIGDALRLLEAMIKRMQAQQQAQAQEQQGKLATAESVIQERTLEAKIYEIQKKAELEAMKQQSLNQMRAQKTAEQMDISRQRAAADIQLKSQKLGAEIELERAAQAQKQA